MVTVHRVSENTGWLQPTHEHCCENLYYFQNLCAEAVTIASFRIPHEQQQKMKKKTNLKWLIKIVLISVAASMAFMFATAKALEYINFFIAFAVLAAFIMLGIIFDMIGIAVAAAVEAPFHSMAAHRESGAAESLWLIRNADKVSSFCNDVVGDVSGIVSGAAAALIAARLVHGLDRGNIFASLIISGVVTGLTIGGKAAGKTFAFNNSTMIVFRTGKIIRALHFKSFSKRG